MAVLADMAALAAEMRRGSRAALFKLYEETGRVEAKTHPTQPGQREGSRSAVLNSLVHN